MLTLQVARQKTEHGGLVRAVRIQVITHCKQLHIQWYIVI